MSQWRLLIIILLGTILFLLAILKASTAAITWDEAFTYLEFIKTGKLYPGAGGGMAANNHLLNTWISFAFTEIFGANEFTLRFGNILFYAVYLVASGWLALRSSNLSVSLAVFFLFNLNPYLFDFFCLSRGYGMAHTCLLLSIVFIFSFFRTEKNKWLIWMIFSALAGMLAGTMLLPAFGMLYAIVFFVFPFLQSDRSQLRSWFDAIYSSLKRIPAVVHGIYVIALLTGAAYLILLQKFNAYLFGGTSGIADDMFLSIIINSKYHSAIPEIFYATASGVLILVVAITVVIYKKRYGFIYSAEGKTAMVLILTFAGIVFSSGIMHFVFSTPLPAERTALYLYVIFAATITFLLTFETRREFLFRIICLGVAILLTTHFVFVFSLKTFYEWRTDADAPLMIHELSFDYFSKKNEPVQAVASLELELPLKFYLEKSTELNKKINLQRISNRVGEPEIYFLDSNDSGIADTLAKDKGWSKTCFPQGGVLVLKPVSGQ